jgi:hypothetical protein
MFASWRAVGLLVVSFVGGLPGCVVEVDEDASTGEGGAPSGGASSATSAQTTSAGAGGSTANSGSGSGTMSNTTGPTTGTGPDPSQCPNGPLAAPLPGCAPTPPPSSGDPHQDCVDRINQFRWECQCLPPLQRWVDGEACTDQQSADDQAANAPHGHFPACGENAQNSCPNWGSTTDVVQGCLQVMWDEGPGEPFSAHGHYINMSSMGYSKVACGFSTTASGTWSNQNFAP